MINKKQLRRVILNYFNHLLVRAETMVFGAHLCWSTKTEDNETNVFYPKSTLRVLRILMHLTSGHVTLLPGEFQSSECSPAPNRRRWTHARLCPKFLVAHCVQTPNQSAVGLFGPNFFLTMAANCFCCFCCQSSSCLLDTLSVQSRFCS